MTTVNQQDLYDCIMADILANIDLPWNQRAVVFVESSPGQGKSQIIAQVIRDLNNNVDFMARIKTKYGADQFQLIDMRLVNREPVDLLGLPAINGEMGTVDWIPPGFLPRPNTAGVFFIDEYSQAPVQMQNSCAQAIHDGVMGTYAFPEGWQFALAGNRTSDRAGAFAVPSNIRGRTYRLTLEADLEIWAGWAQENEIDVRVVSFCRFRPDLFVAFDAQAAGSPNPRAWAYTSGVCNQNMANEKAAAAKIAGYVGEGAQVEFSAYCRVFADLPNVPDIVAHPTTALVPDKPDTLFAIATAVARHATADNCGALITYLSRLPAEYSVLGVRDLVRQCEAATECREFVTYAASHSDMVL